MPLFEFHCGACGAQFEKLVLKAGMYQGLRCPVCGSVNVEEILSTFASPGKGASSDSQAGRCKPAGG